jgi:recombination protein RecA
VAPPFKQVVFDLLYGEGISREGEIIELGVAHDLIDKAGSWYSYNGDRIGQGKDNVRNFLKENPDIAFDLEEKIKAILLPDLSEEAADKDVDKKAAKKTDDAAKNDAAELEKVKA